MKHCSSTIFITRMSLIISARFPYPRPTPSHNCWTSLYSRRGAIANPRRSRIPVDSRRKALSLRPRITASLAYRWSRWFARSKRDVRPWTIVTSTTGLHRRNSVARKRAKPLVARIYRPWRPITWHTYTLRITHITLHDTHPHTT